MVARSMTGCPESVRGRAERTPAESIELSLLWIGRIVVVASFALVGAHLDGTALLMVVLYLGYVINYWETVRTHRVEVTVLTCIAVGLTVFCVATEMLQLARGAEAGAVISVSVAVSYLVAAS
ncbi:MAG: hypothetical protein OXF41_03975 [bacterium]|nr:hypothetical protein [bacterium]